MRHVQKRDRKMFDLGACDNKWHAATELLGVEYWGLLRIVVAAASIIAFALRWLANSLATVWSI